VANPSNKSDPAPATTQQPSSSSLIDSFATLRIEPPEPPTSASPPEKCPIADLPEELLTQILTSLAIIDISAFARIPQVCKRLAYLSHTEESIWKRVALGAEWGFAGMHYDYACTIEGAPLDSFSSSPHLFIEEREAAEKEISQALESRTEELLRTTYTSSYRQIFRSRPRIRFAGVYISTVNYTRAGGPAQNTLTWGAPVHMVTYFRYLRFFRDGSLISLLTTSEPADVVHHLTKENLHGHHGHSMLPSVVMKDALAGRWRLTGGKSSATLRSDGDAVEERAVDLGGEEEQEGEVLIETQGVVPKYVYVMRLVVSSAGKVTRGNKLAWKGFWSWNRLTEDWGKFELRNDRAFYWSRVRSFE
jgi:F-box protein 9